MGKSSWVQFTGLADVSENVQFANCKFKLKVSWRSLLKKFYPFSNQVKEPSEKGNISQCKKKKNELNTY